MSNAYVDVRRSFASPRLPIVIVTFLLLMTATSVLASSEPISPQPYQPPIFDNINVRTSSETKQVSGTLDNPCTVARESIALTGGMQLKQNVWTASNGAKYRILLNETTSVQGTDSAGNVIYASGSSTSDVIYGPTPFTLLMFKKMSTNDNFHVVFVLDIDPVALLIRVTVEAACQNGLP